MFKRNIEKISFIEAYNNDIYITVELTQNNRTFQKDCNDANELECCLLDIKNDIGNEAIAEIIVNWINDSPNSSSSDNIYNIISKALYNIGVLDQFDTKHCLFIKFPEEATINKLSISCPLPEKYLKTSDFKNNIIESIILDLKNTTYIDSSGISYILKIINFLKNTKKSLEISGLTERSVICAIEKTKLHSLLKKDYETIDEFYRRSAKPTVEYKEEQLLHNYAKKDNINSLNFDIIKR